MKLVAAEQQRINEAARQLLIGFSSGEQIEARNWDLCHEAAKQVLARVVGYVNVGIATADDRKVLCSGLQPPSEIVTRRATLFNDMVPSGDLLIGRHHIGLLAEKPVLTVALPIPQANDTGRLIAWANIDLEWLASHFGDRFNSPNLTLLIADSQGTVLVRLPDNDKWAGKPMGEQFAALLNAATEGVVETVAIDGQERIIAYNPLSVEPQGLYVGVGLSKAPYMESIDRSAYLHGGLSFALLALGMSAAWLIANFSIRRPVEKLLVTTRAWQSGDLNARAQLPKDRSEINRLGGAFDEMAAAMQKREEHERLLVRELEHRSGNLLAIVQSIAHLSLSGSSLRSAREAFQSRLQALARSNRLVNSANGAAVNLGDIVRAELATYGDRTSFEGNNIPVSPSTAQKLTLALHELMTNAAKYGALSEPKGRVKVSWRVEQKDGERFLRMRWEERNGPVVSPPTREGFGSILIKASFPNAKADFRATGLIYEFETVLEFATTAFVSP